MSSLLAMSTRECCSIKVIYWCYQKLTTQSFPSLSECTDQPYTTRSNPAVKRLQRAPSESSPQATLHTIRR
ncbi:hypothetical protein E2C01_087735 [Portunus trituberculatus]|uniref:Uncharacterized protein n=1 Tax=Portunus trituberculatus TaxID=210409 RepID=A0A5B7JK63_PORTR|nr:hypothetical protein [Portunus trituberculatus]